MKSLNYFLSGLILIDKKVNEFWKVFQEIIDIHWVLGTLGHSGNQINLSELKLCENNFSIDFEAKKIQVYHT